MTGIHQVSTGGGCTPVWRKDGKELFYMAEHGQVMSVDVKAGLGLETGPPRVLFDPGEVRGPCNGKYGVIASGQKFLVIEAPRLPIDDGRIHVVPHWDTALPH